MRFPRGPVTNALVIINLVIAAILMVPVWWQYALVSGGLFPVRLSGDSTAFADSAFLVPAILTPLTAAFLPGGIASVVFNLVTFMFVGQVWGVVAGCGRRVQAVCGARVSRRGQIGGVCIGCIVPAPSWRAGLSRAASGSGRATARA